MYHEYRSKRISTKKIYWEFGCRIKYIEKIRIASYFYLSSYMGVFFFSFLFFSLIRPNRCWLQNCLMDWGWVGCLRQNGSSMKKRERERSPTYNVVDEKHITMQRPTTKKCYVLTQLASNENMSLNGRCALLTNSILISMGCGWRRCRGKVRVS